MSEPLVLLYHHLCRAPCPFTKHLGIHHHAKVFECHVKELLAHRQIVDLSEIPSVKEPGKCAAIYFDDGYYSIYQYVLPLVKKYRTPVTIFLNTTAIREGITWLNKLSWLFDNLSLHDRCQLAHAALPSYRTGAPPSASEFVNLFDERCTPDAVDTWWRRYGAPMPATQLFLGEAEIRELAACNLFTFGSHSANHYPLDRLGTLSCRDEIIQGHRELERLIPNQVRGFSVPFARLGKPTIFKAVPSISDLVVVAQKEGYIAPKKGRVSFVWGTTAPRGIRCFSEKQEGNTPRANRGRLPAGVKISWVRFSELVSLADTLDELPPHSLVPISKQRASLMATCPCACKDDVALELAWSNDRAIVGYWGLFPGELSSSSSRIRAHFASTGMVHPDVRGRGLPRVALREMAYHTKIFCAVGNNRDADRMLHNLGLEHVSRQQGYALNLRCLNPKEIFLYCLRSAQALCGRGGEWRAMQGQEVSLRNTPYIFTIASQLGVACGGQKFSLEARRLLESSSGARWSRSAEVIEWMADNPWDGPTACFEGRENEYYFSRRNLTVRYIRLEIRGRQSALLEGAGLIQIVANHHTGVTVVRGLDTVITDRTALAKYLATLVGLAVAHRAARVELPKQCAPRLLQKLLPKLIVSPIVRKYYYWAALPDYKELIERADASLCDSDLGLY